MTDINNKSKSDGASHKQSAGQADSKSNEAETKNSGKTNQPTPPTSNVEPTPPLPDLTQENSNNTDITKVLAAFQAEITALHEKVEQSESENRRQQLIKQHNISPELKSLITGKSEEEITEQIEALKKVLGDNGVGKTIITGEGDNKQGAKPPTDPFTKAIKDFIGQK